MKTDRDEPFPAAHKLIDPHRWSRQKGPLLLGRPTKTLQQQNLWGLDELQVRVYQRHRYRTLTINSLAVWFPTMHFLDKFACEINHVPCVFSEQGDHMNIAISGAHLRQLQLPPEMVLNFDAVSGERLLLLQREQRIRSGWLPPTAASRGGG